MICTKGQPLKPEIKQVIVALKEYFDRNKSQFVTQDRSTQMVADALGIGLATVNRVMASYRKNPESIHEVSQARGRPSYSIDASHEEFVRAYIRKANADGSHITLEMIQKLLFERASKEDFHLSTLARTLDRWGFEFVKGTRTQHLKEKDHVVLARQQYLRKIRGNRSKSKRPEVYLDESYVNKNHSNDFIWYYGDDGAWVQKPTGNVRERKRHGRWTVKHNAKKFIK